jgi:hypothetical protein
MEKFEQFLARRDEAFFDFLRGSGKGKPNPADRQAPPQLKAPAAPAPSAPTDLRTALHQEFGGNPYHVDGHLIDALASGDRSVLNAIASRYGRDTAVAMQQVMRLANAEKYVGGNMRRQQQQDANDFAAGHGNWR